ncbi:MAG: DUF3267 domain-containing protein [Clostridia bacterium]|nr:DUF3267 domain-containing protein [Clostridia bacterium]
MKKEQNFEKTLPEHYEQVYHLNAKDVKMGLILNLIALIVFIAVMGAAILVLLLGKISFVYDPIIGMIASGVFMLAVIGYIVLHELVHGIAYKSLTGEKLTFGFSWSCAFCGVPHIFTYRKTALIAICAPFVVFTLLFLPLTAMLYFVNPLFYLMAAALLGLHIGGCAGDLYLMALLLFKYKNSRLLMKDTGPEMTLFVPKEP